MRAKQALREETWRALQERGVARFPGGQRPHPQLHVCGGGRAAAGWDGGVGGCVPLDWIVTPDDVIACRHGRARPAGLLWDHLRDAKIDEIPLLRRLAPASTQDRSTRRADGARS